MNNQAIITAINNSILNATKAVSKCNDFITTKAADFINLEFSVESLKKFFQDISVTPSTKMTLEEARVTSVKNANPTTYDRYDPIHGLHAAPKIEE